RNIPYFLYIRFVFYDLNSFSVITTGIHFLNKRQRKICFRFSLNHLKFRAWDLMFFIKFLLKDFLLNGFDDFGARNYFDSTFLKFKKCIYIHMFNFNGNNIFSFSEIENRFVVVEISFSKIRNRGTRSIFRRIQSEPFIIIFQRILYQHSAKLAATEDSYFHSSDINFTKITDNMTCTKIFVNSGIN